MESLRLMNLLVTAKSQRTRRKVMYCCSLAINWITDRIAFVTVKSQRTKRQLNSALVKVSSFK